MPVPRPTLARAQIERRTLPGHTIITGIADADVASVTIATPRDVRTLRPSGPQHALIVVYDGQFFKGALTATVRLREGRVVSESIPNPSAGSGAVEPPRPALAKQLQRDRVTLAGMRAQVASAEHAPARRRASLLHGAPLSMIVEGLHNIQGIVAAEERRLAFVRAHPGVLPLE